MYVGNQTTYDIVDPKEARWDYWNTTDPLTTTNPSHLYAVWMNLDTAERFVCIDNTMDANVWEGSRGTTVS